MAAQARTTVMMPARPLHSTNQAASANSASNPSNPPLSGAAPLPRGQNTCQAKNTARFSTTPTTAAVTPVSGAVKRRSSRVASTSGPPARMNKKQDRKVKKVATTAPAAPASSSDCGPNTWCVQAPTKPTKATTMIRGPGVVSPRPRPSIICGPVSQWKCSTPAW